MIKRFSSHFATFRITDSKFLFLSQSFLFKRNSIPAEFYKISDILMICTFRVLQNIFSVKGSEKKKRNFLRQIVQLRKTENFAGTIILTGIITGISVGKLCRYEVVISINISNNVFKIEGFRRIS